MKYEHCGKLFACGIDAETAERFIPIASTDDHSMPFVFTKRELDHCRSHRFPAQALCACFCCKEALFKALSEPYNYTDCELMPVQIDGDQELFIDNAILKSHCITAVRARTTIAITGELIAIVNLFRAG